MNTELLIPNIKNTSICVHTYHTENSKWDWHIHDEYELFMCLSGNITFSLPDASPVLSKGDIIIINQKIPHKTEVNDYCDSYFIQFKPVSNIDFICFNLLADSSTHFVFEYGSKINTCLSLCLCEILDEYKEKKPSYEDFINADVYKIFAILCRYGIIKSPAYYTDSKEISKLVPVLEYISNNYGAKITVSEMSSLINVDKSHFCRLFKKGMNMTMIDYLNLVRISMAEKLLLSTKKSISEICDETGFSSTAYFCKLFKRYKLCPPSQYRKYKKRTAH